MYPSLELIDKAAKAFGGTGFGYGDVIPRAWFDEAFGLKKPEESIADMQANQILYASMMGHLRARLLAEKQMALRVKPGFGQQVVWPADQTAWAMSEAKDTISKALAKAQARVENVNLSMLNPEERRANADARAKLSFFGRNRLSEL